MSEIQGEAHQVSRSDEGKLSVRFPSLPFVFSAPYWVVDSDYDNYAVVWGCNDFGVFHTRQYLVYLTITITTNLPSDVQ
jgi:apolipoprotein D and lipocalin family protein